MSILLRILSFVFAVACWSFARGIVTLWASPIHTFMEKDSDLSKKLWMRFVVILACEYAKTSLRFYASKICQWFTRIASRGWFGEVKFLPQFFDIYSTLRVWINSNNFIILQETLKQNTLLHFLCVCNKTIYRYLRPTSGNVASSKVTWNARGIISPSKTVQRWWKTSVQSKHFKVKISLSC